MYIDTSASTRICLNAANADTATKLAEPKTIEITGAVTGSVRFDGSADVNISTNVNHTHLYAGSATAGGPANSAIKLVGTEQGSQEWELYDGFDDDFAVDNLSAQILFFDTYDNQHQISSLSAEYIKVGSASKADKLNTARTLTIGSSGKAFDGSSNVSWTLAEIGAAAASHTHNYAGSDSAGGPANSVKDINTGTDKLDKITFNSSDISDIVYDNGGTASVAVWNGSVIGSADSSWLTVDYASTANHLQNARTLTIGNSGKTFNGSSNVSWTLNEIGALPLTGGTVTGTISGPTTSNSWIKVTKQGSFNMPTAPGADSAASVLSIKTQSGSWGLATLQGDESLYFVYGSDTNYDAGNNQITKIVFTNSGNVSANKVYGAVWNDYAEFRISNCLEPGRVVCEYGDDTLSIASKRLQPGASIISDTYGFAIGETDEAKCPIAVSGRVLAYGYEDKDEFKLNIGRPVCAGPNGTVSIMTDDEYKNYGYCAIGTISAVPDYEEWGTGKIKVNNRIWIKVV